jgi:hypothetical protein
MLQKNIRLQIVLNMPKENIIEYFTRFVLFAGTGRNLANRLGKEINVKNKLQNCCVKNCLPHPRNSDQKEESGLAGVVGGHRRLVGGVRPRVAAETGSRDDEAA